MPFPQTNLLLDSLSESARGAILRVAKDVRLPVRASLQSQEETPLYVFFLTSGVASLVVNLPEGGASETAIIGREGVVGGFMLLGPSLSPSQNFMQVAGSGYRVPFSAMQELFAKSEEIRSRILENIQQQAMTVTQIAACNITHEAEPRLARWLLMVRDRTGEETFLLTQEFLAEMLGARRTTVALAAGALQRSGFIEYSRGKIHIRSPEHLETAACECYAVTKRLLSSLYR